MKRIHTLRVSSEIEGLAELVAAVRADGGRVGWLELGPDLDPEDEAAAGPGPEPLPAGLERRAAEGFQRAVAVEPGRTLAAKPLRGRPVLRDLLREHFLGCRLVLIQGAADTPELVHDAEGWMVRSPAGVRRFTTERLVAALRRPRPWGES